MNDQKTGSLLISLYLFFIRNLIRQVKLYELLKKT